MLIATYNGWLVGLSIALAMLVSYTALTLVARVSESSGGLVNRWLVGGAVAMGGGIWSMHFVGMLAFHLPIRLRYGLPLTGASLLIAVLTSGFALSIASRDRLRLRQLASGALLMGSGIVAMHYLGMSAITVTPDIEFDPWLVTASVLIAVAASATALWLAFHLRSGHSRRAMLGRIAAAAVMGLAISGMHYVGMAASRFADSSFCISGVAIDRGWGAASLSLITVSLLTLTLLLALVDARVARRLREHVAKLQEADAALEYQRWHDPLTGLANRQSFASRLQAAIRDAEPEPPPFAVVTLDLDRFRLINDSLGHRMGDGLLAVVGERLTHSVPQVETLARGSGDDFMLSLRGFASRAELEFAVHDIVGAFATPFVVNDVELHVSVSVGVAVFPDDGGSAETLLAHAETALYEAKGLGGNRAHFYHTDGARRSEGRLDLENDLRRALQSNQFEVYYQPKLDVATNRIASAEALLRWHHPTRGVVPPNEFIPVAEETGLIVPIGRWVLDEVCSQLRQWQAAGLPPIRVAVNVSAVQLREGRFADEVRQVTERHQVSPAQLEIELTESAVMNNAEYSARVLADIKALGASVAVDDFGTGYSSMNLLRRLPIDCLKIDRSFVAEIAHLDDARSIVQAIISLGRALRLRTVAEGVETKEQRDTLVMLECDELQGYLIQRPVTAARFEALLRGSWVSETGVESIFRAPARSSPVLQRSAAAQS
ncbi:MAG: bifunctional diguanylate cyclase/phosphodiesterase [Proteobacteria bacterium]|nr:bifunctional diguanylate cyclase/phosphodiesterase [Pseudomonadota bacterium]